MNNRAMAYTLARTLAHEHTKWEIKKETKNVEQGAGIEWETENAKKDYSL